MAKKKTAGANALVVLQEDTRVYFRGQMIELSEGQGIDDPEFARFLVETGAPVEKTSLYQQQGV